MATKKSYKVEEYRPPPLIQEISLKDNIFLLLPLKNCAMLLCDILHGDIWIRPKINISRLFVKTDTEGENMPGCSVTVSMWGCEGGWGVSHCVSADGERGVLRQGRHLQSFMAYLRRLARTLYLHACLQNRGELITKFEPFVSYKHLVAQFKIKCQTVPQINYQQRQKMPLQFKHKRLNNHENKVC